MAMANAHASDNRSGSFCMSDSTTGAGMPSRNSLLSNVDSVGHSTNISLLRDDKMLLKAGHVNGEHSEPAAEHAKSKQGTLMRKLSWLINPKKKLPKTVARKRASAMPEGGSEAKDHLELLFAQAEATLGELLVRAGASFNARSSLQEDHHHHHNHHERAQSTGGAESTSVRLGGSFSRSGAVAGQGHARRNSLSRAWQQVGGSLFCGSGHLNALVMEEMELRGIAPLPQTSSATYFGDGIGGDGVADESYWQSLAESILMQREKMADVDQHAIHQQNENSIKDNMVETSHDFSVISASQHMRIQSREQEAECLVSEIMSVPSDTDVQGRQKDECRWACGMADCSLEDLQSELPVPVEFGDGCTRLNTTLDASPNLAHNYQLHMKSNAGNRGVGSSSGKSVVELLNYYSLPVPSLAGDQVVELIPTPAVAASSSSTACSSSSSVEAAAQPLEDFLWHARGRWSEPDEANSVFRSNVAVSGTASSSVEVRTQQMLESANCARVSLMTLLHEEAAAVECADAPHVVEAVGHAQTATPQEEGLVGEEPLALLCCVCMVRRKGAALIPCGHTFCRICSKQLFAGRGACPLCNNLIVQLLDIF